jgi:hypothetical protein
MGAIKEAALKGEYQELPAPSALYQNLKGFGLPLNRGPAGEFFCLSGIAKELPLNCCEAAIMALAKVCNHASTWDGCGFSGADVEFGHSLARQAQKYGFSPKQLAALQVNPSEAEKAAAKAAGQKRPRIGLIVKYRKQLEQFGFNLDQLLDQAPVEKEPRKKDADVVFKARLVKHASSGKAFLVQYKGQEFWLPVSQTEVLEVTMDLNTYSIPFWLAKEKGVTPHVETVTQPLNDADKEAVYDAINAAEETC